MPIRQWAIAFFAICCAQAAIGQDFSTYVSCNDTVLATTPESAFLPASPTFTMRISPLVSPSGVTIASGANVQLWRVACPDGTSSVTALRITPDAQQPPSDALGLRYYIFQANAPRKQATLYSYISDVAGPTTGTLLFPPISVSSPLPLEIDGDPDRAFTVEAFDSANTLRGLANIPGLIAGALGIAPQVGLWWNPAEPGSGYALDVKHGILVVTVYSYTDAGDPMWYLASGPIANNAFTGTVYNYAGGPCLSCNYRTNAVHAAGGTIRINFTSSTTATLTLPGGRTIPIVPQAF